LTCFGYCSKIKHMEISVLMENLSKDEKFKTEHGLSLYIESLGKKILFDTGQSSAFIENAQKMGIDLKNVDFLVISHGHYDHTGGLKAFLELNKKAVVYIQKSAFKPYYSDKGEKGIKAVGIDSKNLDLKRFVCLDGDFDISDNFKLINKISSSDLVSVSNNSLLKKDDKGNFVKDDFLHEQNLLIKENEKKVLITGCAHRGIVNIIRQAEQYCDGPLTAVLGGFHLSSPSRGTCESDSLIDGVANFLKQRPTEYFTGHCTGLIGYGKLKDRLKSKVNYLGCSTILEL